MEKYKIYALLNPVSKNIRYIGFTSTSLKRRLRNHINEAKSKNQSHIHKNKWILKIIKVYKKEPLIVLIKSFENEKDAKNLEIELISKLKNLTNTTKGGEGQLGREVPEYVRQKFSKKVDVYCKTSLVKLFEFNSISEVARKLKIPASKISNVCNGKRKTAYSYIFRFKNEDVNKYDFESKRGKNSSIKKKVLRELDNKIYTSIAEAAKDNNISKSSLTFLLKNPLKKNGERRMCKQKYFSYYKEDIVQST